MSRVVRHSLSTGAAAMFLLSTAQAAVLVPIAASAIAPVAGSAKTPASKPKEKNPFGKLVVPMKKPPRKPASPLPVKPIRTGRKKTSHPPVPPLRTFRRPPLPKTETELNPVELEAVRTLIQEPNPPGTLLPIALELFPTVLSPDVVMDLVDAGSGPAESEIVLENAEIARRLREWRAQQTAPFSRRSPLPPGDFLAPVGNAMIAFTRVRQARTLLDARIAAQPWDDETRRRETLLDLEAAIVGLQEAGPALLSARAWVDRVLPDNARRGKLIGTYRIKPQSLRTVLDLGIARQAQYLAEARWWRAECANPAKPDRAPAIEALQQELETVKPLGLDQKYISDLENQLLRYRFVSQCAAAGR
jgi:hypothetical protein